MINYDFFCFFIYLITVWVDDHHKVHDKVLYIIHCSAITFLVLLYLILKLYQSAAKI